MLRRLYDWTLHQADRPHAVWVLAGISFAESSFFPLPPDILLIPMMLAARQRAFRYAAVATLSSVAGGFLGYAIGDFLFATVGHWIVVHLASQAGFDQVRGQFARWGFWLIVIKGLTPIPYKIVTIFCGFMHYDLALFALASLLARALRFVPEAILLHHYGDHVRGFIERRLIWVTSAFAVLLVGAFAVLKLV